MATAVQPSVYFSRSSGFRSVRRVYPLCCYPIPETPALDTEEMFLSFIELRVRSPLLSEADRSTLVLARHRFYCASVMADDYGLRRVWHRLHSDAAIA